MSSGIVKKPEGLVVTLDVKRLLVSNTYIYDFFEGKLVPEQTFKAAIGNLAYALVQGNTPQYASGIHYNHARIDLSADGREVIITFEERPLVQKEKP